MAKSDIELNLVPGQQGGTPDEPPKKEARGVHNPNVIDLISHDKEADEVVLTLLEERPWGADGDMLRQLEAKLNNYLGYVLEGFLVQQYPQYDGKKVRFELDCASTPGDDEVPFLRAAGNFAAGEGITFVVNVIQG